MKKVLFILSIVALVSCSSNETSTSSVDSLNCKDSACCDSTVVDSLENILVKPHVDSLVTDVKELKK